MSFEVFLYFAIAFFHLLKILLLLDNLMNDHLMRLIFEFLSVSFGSLLGLLSIGKFLLNH